MTDENDKTQEQSPAAEQSPAPEQPPAPAPAELTNGFTAKQPQQKTINVVGGVVIATLVAIVLAQAMGDNNELASNEMRLPGGPPNGQLQGPGGMGQGQMAPGQQGQGQMGPGQQGDGKQGPRPQGGPGMGPQGEGGQQRHDERDGEKGDRDDKSEKDDDKDDNQSGTSQNNTQPAPQSRAS